MLDTSTKLVSTMQALTTSAIVLVNDPARATTTIKIPSTKHTLISFLTIITYYAISTILYVVVSAGVLISTDSPLFLPNNATPIGDSSLILPFSGSASTVPTT